MAIYFTLRFLWDPQTAVYPLSTYTQLQVIIILSFEVLFIHSIALAKQEDNGFGSVHPSVCVCLEGTVDWLRNPYAPT